MPERVALEGFVEVDGAAVWYRDGGVPSGVPVLLVHGSGAHHGWWHAMVPGLRRRHRVIEIDLSGHGESDHRDDSYTLTGWVDEIVAVLDESAVQSTVLVGHSMGGKICAAVAATHPDRASGLVLFDVGLPSPARWRVRPRWIEGVQRHAPTKDELVARFSLAPPQPDPPAAALAAVIEASVRHDEHGWTWRHDRRRMPILPDDVIGEHARRVRCPIAFIHAEHSHAVNEDVLAHVRSFTVPVLETCVERTHHHLVLERPDACVDLVVAWMDTLDIATERI